MNDRYETDFLDSDWDGAGLDLQYSLVLRDERRLAQEIEPLLPRLLDGAALERWDAVRTDGRVGSGDNLETLRRFLGGCAALNVTLWASEGLSAEERFYIEVVAPNRVSIGAPSEFFYTGSTPRDLVRIDMIVRRVALLARDYGDFAGAFAVAEEAERLAERAADEGNFRAPWTDAERQAVVEDVLRNVTEFRQ